jgi:eukaryotic-like serine/threonine-protein kinase
MPAPSSVDQKTFLAYLLQSGLISAKDMEAVAKDLPDTHRGRVLARALVEKGILTKFQAERLLAGRTSGFILGQYRLLDCLGQGGMGSVFKAVHQTMNRVVALKVLAPRLMETEQAQALFLREMRAVAQLSHPNLVTAYDANQVGRRYYLVMEYVDGPNLDRLVQDQGALPIGLACELIRQAALGLQYAHSLGVVHRDIKPSNLLVILPRADRPQKTCQVKVLDFGLARLQGSLLDTLETTANQRINPSVVVGTPDFIAPEQAKDFHSADIRSDLYSLGCTFYFLLTGQLPYPGGSTAEKLVRHATEDARLVNEIRPDTSAGLSRIVKRLMAKEPRDRFATPAELASKLESFAVPDRIPESYSRSELTTGSSLSTPPPIPDDFLVGLEPVPGREAGILADSLQVDEVAALVNTSVADSSRITLLDRRKYPQLINRRWWRNDRFRLLLASWVAVLIVCGVFAILALLGSK